MAKQTHRDVMNNLKSLTKVREHLNKLPVQLGKQILKQRIELGLTQKQVVILSRRHNRPITQAQLSKIEIGDENVTLHTYEKVLEALGATNVNIDFDNAPTEKELVQL